MPVEIREVDSGTVEDLSSLFSTDKGAAACWCMWFIIPVKDYHAAGGRGNQASFRELMASSGQPLGLVAYRDGVPVGWCAVGPRSRYARAIRTPTYKGRDPDEDDDVWLLPCIFVRPDARRSALCAELIGSAVRLAKARGAAAIEAFPLSGRKRRSNDTQVGFEPAFAACGFTVKNRPSDARALMRLDFNPDREARPSRRS